MQGGPEGGKTGVREMRSFTSQDDFQVNAIFHRQELELVW